MHKCIHCVKPKNGVIPGDTLGKVLDECNSFQGVAMAKDGEIVLARLPEGATAEKIAAMEQKFSDFTLLFAFGKGATPIMNDDIQPFTILENAQGKPILVACLDGDFTEFEEAESSHSAQHFAVLKDLRPRIQKLFKANDNDLAKLMADFDTEMTARDIINTMVGSRGTITFLAGNGMERSLHVRGDDTHATYEGGVFMSNTLEPPVVEEEAQPQGGANELEAMLGSSKSDTAAKPQAAAPVVKGRTATVHRPVASTEPVGPKPNAGDTKANTHAAGTAPDVKSPVTIVEGDGEYETIKVPLFTGKNQGKQRKRWLRDNAPELLDANGNLPKSWHSIKEFQRKRPSSVKSMADIKALTGSTAIPADAGGSPQVKGPPKDMPASTHSVPQVKGRGGDKISAQMAAAADISKAADTLAKADERRAVKDTAAHHLPSVTTEPIPIIPAAEKKAMVENFNKNASVKEAIDRHRNIVKNPEALDEYENRVPPISQQLPTIVTSLDVFNEWPFELMLDIAKQAPYTMAVAFFNVVSSRRKVLAGYRNLAAQKAAGGEPTLEAGAIPPVEEEHVEEVVAQPVHTSGVKTRPRKVA